MTNILDTFDFKQLRDFSEHDLIQKQSRLIFDVLNKQLNAYNLKRFVIIRLPEDSFLHQDVICKLESNGVTVTQRSMRYNRQNCIQFEHITEGDQDHTEITLSW